MTSGRSDIVDIAATLVHTTKHPDGSPKAYLLDHGGEKPVWVPASAVEDNGDGTYAMPERLAKERGFI